MSISTINLRDIGTNPHPLTQYIGSGGAINPGASLIPGDSLPSIQTSGTSALYDPLPSTLQKTYTVGMWIGSPAGNYSLSFCPSIPPNTSSLANCFLRLYMSGNQFIASMGDGTSFQYLIGLNHNQNVPHFVCVTSNGTTGQLFVDGVLEATLSITLNNSVLNSYLVLGASWFSSSWNYLALNCQNVCVFDSVLSASQIRALYQSGSYGVQTLDNLTDGYSYLKVAGVNTSNQTTATSYSAQSVQTSHIANQAVTGTQIANSAVNTPQITSGAVSTNAATTVAGNVTITGSWASVVSLSLSTTAASNFLVNYQCELVMSGIPSGAYFTISIQLYLNGTAFGAAQTLNFRNTGSAGYTFGFPASLCGLVTGSIGGTWSVEAIYAGSGGGTPEVSSQSLTVVALKV